MGLAPYGEPVFAETIRRQLIDLKDDGSFRMDLSYFRYCQGLVMTSPRFARLFGGPPRRPEAPLTEREMNLAASIQQVTEEIMLRSARHLHRITGMKNLCLAGGVALNCVGNGRILREGPFENIWIQPAAGDAGGALGAALIDLASAAGQSAHRHGLRRAAGLAARARVLRRRNPRVSGRPGGPLPLPRRTKTNCAAAWPTWWPRRRSSAGCKGGWSSAPGPWAAAASWATPAAGNAVGMNLKIKFRESFRPFAPVVLQERARRIFRLARRPRKARTCSWWPRWRPAAAARRRRAAPDWTSSRSCSSLPAVTHVDYSARVQTVDAAGIPGCYKLLKVFEAKTGCPVMINTSFNVRGEPIVCRPEDAYRCFLATNMDALALERFLLLKEEQSNVRPYSINAHLARFAPD